MIVTILRWLCYVALAIGFFYGLYQFLISFHLFSDVRPPHPAVNPIHRFAVLICARNEAAVIRQLLDSLFRQNYPSEAFDVFVTADNCTDGTAEAARAAGATVFERFDLEHRGKGCALNWTFSRFLQRYRGQYDACVIFDADNVADPHFLEAMNRQLNAGHRIAAGFRKGKNPSSSWVSGCSSLFWLLQTRLFFVPRANLGLPCFSVGGTGFMFDLDVLGEQGWQTRSVCEDIEFSLNSIADGQFIAYAPDAVFYDEQPLTFMQSLKQRYRWSLGGVQILSISTPRLWRAVLSGKKRVGDALIYSVGIPVTGVSGICGVLLTVLSMGGTKNVPGAIGMAGVSGVLGYCLIICLACLVLFFERTNWQKSWKAILTFPLFLASWSVLNAVVLFYRKAVWEPIPHVESLPIEAAEKAFSAAGASSRREPKAAAVLERKKSP